MTTAATANRGAQKFRALFRRQGCHVRVSYPSQEDFYDRLPSDSILVTFGSIFDLILLIPRSFDGLTMPFRDNFLG
jgi:hypothetical protein